MTDDEVAIRFTIEILLRRQGYNITSATSGTEALALISSNRLSCCCSI